MWSFFKAKQAAAVKNEATRRKKNEKSGNDDPFNRLWLIYTNHEAHLAAQESGFATLLNGMIETTSFG